jgi:hypothetical protein
VTGIPIVDCANGTCLRQGHVGDSASNAAADGTGGGPRYTHGNV